MISYNSYNINTTQGPEWPLTFMIPLRDFFLCDHNNTADKKFFGINKVFLQQRSTKTSWLTLNSSQTTFLDITTLLHLNWPVGGYVGALLNNCCCKPQLRSEVMSRNSCRDLSIAVIWLVEWGQSCPLLLWAESGMGLRSMTFQDTSPRISPQVWRSRSCRETLLLVDSS